jgi:hypothetical protein
MRAVKIFNCLRECHVCLKKLRAAKTRYIVTCNDGWMWAFCSDECAKKFFNYKKGQKIAASRKHGKIIGERDPRP